MLRRYRQLNLSHLLFQRAVPAPIARLTRPFLSTIRTRNKKEAPLSEMLLNGIRQRPILPGRVQPSTFGTEGLNFCVRDGNRWDPFVIATGNGELFNYDQVPIAWTVFAYRLLRRIIRSKTAP